VTLLALRGVCCKIDHVLHGGIASAAVYGALVGVTAAQIESVGWPFRDAHRGMLKHALDSGFTGGVTL
jgi:hypothetical protein